MCTRPITRQFPPSVHDRLLGVFSPRVLSLPCGKCGECLRKRQNDLAVRVYNEAKAKGSAVFVTLTYAPQYVPVAQSLWFVDRESGEFMPWDKPELVPDFRLGAAGDKCDILRGQLKSYKYKGVPQVFQEIKSFSELTENDWFIRFTPTLYYPDVQLAFKRFRKKTGLTNKDFTYVSVGEYGANPEKSMRPHYHLIFFGLSTAQAYQFCDEWLSFDGNKLGFYYVEKVNFINEDQSDGLARVARYVGKYCAKGQFDAYTNKTGCTLANRLHSSKGLGTTLPQNVIDDLLAKDVCQYDENNPYSTIPIELRHKVIDTIIRRSFIEINGFKYGLPQSLKRKLFNYRRTDTRKFTRCKDFEGKCLEISEKAVWSPLYYMVADELRSRFSKEDSKQFQSYLLDFPAENLSQAVDKYNYLQETSRQAREISSQQSILNFYKHHSKL